MTWDKDTPKHGYDLLEPQRNQHVFFYTYLDYTRLLVATMEARRRGNHPMLTGTHVPTPARRAGGNATIARRTRNGRSYGDATGEESALGARDGEGEGVDS